MKRDFDVVFVKNCELSIEFSNNGRPYLTVFIEEDEHDFDCIFSDIGSIKKYLPE